LTNAAVLRRHYTEQRALPFPILENLQPQQVAVFAERPPRLPGVELEIQPTRSYPGGSACAHLLGILRRDDSSVDDEDAFFHYRLPDYKGHTGIEGMFDSELRGTAGVKTMMVNRLGYRQSETLQKPPEPGQNVVLTVDLEIQRAAEQALYTSPFGTNTRGAAVVMDTRTGDIIAMASVPGYDPEIWPHGINHEQSVYLNDSKLRPEVNRATQENYLPGSIFKIVVGLAGLEMGAIDPTEQFDSPGSYKLPGKIFHDRALAGMYDFRLAFIKSCNTYFIKQGLKPGVLQKVIELGNRLHLGERTGILPVQETKGNFPGPRELVRGWSDVDTGNLSIGQGPIDVTPLQMAVVVSAVANGGTVYWPRLVQRVEPALPSSEDAPTLFKPARVRDHLNVSEKSLRIVREAMAADVSSKDGTGKAAAVPGLAVCGKTGTAEIEVGGRIADKTTWFASYAPADRPRFAVVVMVESGASGGGTCAPIAGRIYQALKSRYLAGDSKSIAAAP
jgi:penicillin-binding protein 2